MSVWNVFHRKHFYRVTWERSEALRKEVPWLKDEKHEFCMVGYREPTAEEAMQFTGNKMHDRLFDRVCSVEEISKEEALRDFQIDGWKNQKVFAYKEFHPIRTSLMVRLADARVRSESNNDENKNIKENEIDIG